MLKLTATILVALAATGAFADKLEVLCWKQPADGIGQWRPVGGNPVGCLQVWNVVNNYWRAQCSQAAVEHQQALASIHYPDQVTCQCIETSDPNGDPGGDTGEGGF